MSLIEDVDGTWPRKDELTFTHLKKPNLGLGLLSAIMK